MFTKRERWLIIVTLCVGVVLGYIFFAPEEQVAEEVADQELQEEVWTCSMHPQIKMSQPGKCPICAMDLIPLNTGAAVAETGTSGEVRMTEEALKLADIQTTLVKKGTPEHRVQLFGKIKADERNIAELTARFGGRIEKLMVNYTGQKVVKGQTLGMIYSPELITAQKELLEALKFKQSNPSFYLAARNKLKLLELSAQQIEQIENASEPQLYFEIMAPISGTVTRRHVSLGDYVQAGSPLFQVIDLSRVWVVFDAYESDLPWIKFGDMIDFSLQSVPGKAFSGKVTYIDPFIDATTRVAGVRVELTNREGMLKPEMFANGVLISRGTTELNEILIPKSAILWTGKRAVVYVKVPGRQEPSFLYREITLGPEAGSYYVVAEGLNAGEEIAINGVFRIDAAAQLAGMTSMMSPEGHNMSEVYAHEGHTGVHPGLVTESFRVSGNCGMCENRIESAAAALSGVNSADWNVDSKIMQISFNPEKITLDRIHKTIAAAGHDTELETAPDSVYQTLPECCTYRK